MYPTTIRSQFINYYQGMGFELLPRASMLHNTIPMSFVMSAGLVQVESSLAQISRDPTNKYVLIQKCFRHFDLDRVGQDDLHLSLFEMPGAFVFEKNAKEKAIIAMWQLATSVLGINPSKIWVTYFEGDQVSGEVQEKDTLTYQTWLNLGLNQERIVGRDADHNYWLQSDSLRTDVSELRKAGPNTEMFFDRDRALACGHTCQPGCRCGRFIEFANTLFISYQLRPQHNRFEPLAIPFVETVIGTERVAMITQGVSSVFETTDFVPIINLIQGYVTNKDISQDLYTSSIRIIADHLRALCVLVADGAPPPGKNGRERIIKLLIRQLITRRIILGIETDTFLPDALHVAASTFSPEEMPTGTIPRVTAYFAYESSRFEQTIAQGFRKLKKLLTCNHGRSLNGREIVTLEKQWGLPILLIENQLNQHGLVFARQDYLCELSTWNTTAKTSH
ncbi:MAG: hypothetical protein IPM39_19020 [Chloroflexi bacterium]|nr:hypothetical protein [Chloroflexota bacterium]